MLLDTDGKMSFNTNNASRWHIQSSGHLTPNNQHSYDIGAVNAEVRNIYAQGLFIGGSAAANKLDDYEEGEWTPAFSMSSGSVGYDTTHTKGSFVKVGGVVNIVASMNLSSISSPSGSIGITGLPFACGPGEKYVTGISIGLIRNLTTNFNIVRGYTNSNAASITIHTGATGTGHVPMNANTLKANTQFYFQVSYNTDE